MSMIIKSTKKYLVQIFIFGLFFLLLMMFVSSTRSKEYVNSYPLSLQTDASLQKILLDAHIPEYSFQILKALPHDKNSFTEGLFFKNGVLYESTGLYKNSKLRQIVLKTGNVIKEISLPEMYFGEGITTIDSEVYQLTYKENKGFIYDSDSLKLKQTFSYSGEGWGLTYDGKHLIMSNGTANLVFINPKTGKIFRQLVITANHLPIQGLNELEWVTNKIYANVWPTSIILIISPINGDIKAWLNLTSLRPPTHSEYEYTANGIAFDEKRNSLWVTGKNWPYLYEIDVLTQGNLNNIN